MIWKKTGELLVHSPSRASKMRLQSEPSSSSSSTSTAENVDDHNKMKYTKLHTTTTTLSSSMKDTANLNSTSLTIFLLINSMIGSGILNQPFVFMKSGILGAMFGFMIVTLGTWSGLFLLTEAGIISNIFDFSSLARETLGVKGDQWVDGSIILMSLGSILSYIIIIGETSSDLVQGWGCHHLLCDQFSVTILCVILFVMPACMSRSLGNLAHTSVLSLIAITACLLMVIIYGPSSSSAEVESTAEYPSRAPLVLFDTLGTCMSTGSIILALNCSSANFHAYLSATKDARGVAAWMRITGLAVTIGSAICVSMGLAGYFAFHGNVNGEILSE